MTKVIVHVTKVNVHMGVMTKEAVPWKKLQLGNDMLTVKNKSTIFFGKKVPHHHKNLTYRFNK